jgi:hypothetical protein
MVESDEESQKTLIILILFAKMLCASGVRKIRADRADETNQNLRVAVFPPKFSKYQFRKKLLTGVVFSDVIIL